MDLAKHARLPVRVEIKREVAADYFAATGEKVRFFESIHQAANTWKIQRRVIAKIEHTDKGKLCLKLGKLAILPASTEKYHIATGVCGFKDHFQGLIKHSG